METDTQKPPLIIAHRGCHYPGFNQNTLRSFKQVMDEGARAIEFDVQVTEDGKAVVVHNLDLAEVSTGSGKVRETHSEDLFQLFAGCTENGFDRIPSLEEVFGLMAGCPAESRPVMHLELKGEGSGEVCAALMSAWLENGRLQREDFLISSFNPVELSMMKAAHPQVERAFLCGAVERAPLQRDVPELSGQWDRFFSYPEEDYMMPRYRDMADYGPLAARYIKDPAQRQVLWDTLAGNISGRCYNDGVLHTAEGLGAVAVNTCWANTPESFIDCARGRGFQVLCYTINDLCDMEIMAAKGIDGFFTDEFKAARERFA